MNCSIVPPVDDNVSENFVSIELIALGSFENASSNLSVSKSSVPSLGLVVIPKSAKIPLQLIC